MKKKKIINNFKKKIKNIIKHNKYYFEHDNPLISDATYDQLKKEILKFEKNYPYLKKI